MKIYKLPVDKILQPEKQPFLYPKHNSDYGVEQDFEQFMELNSHLLTDNLLEADWHYLPVFWTRWHLQHDYGSTGLEVLENAVKDVIVDEGKTFTICQYDDGPLVHLGNAIQFLASRKTASGYDLPLLCNEHRKKFSLTKPYLASFAGRISTHPVRKEMRDVMDGQKGVFIYDVDLPSEEYVKLISKSLIALSPRGYGGSSFRFFEAMQLGVVPALIGDLDTRPFKSSIDWSKISFYSESPQDLLRQINCYSSRELREMGRNAKKIFNSSLAYQKWPNLLLAELHGMKS